MNILEKIGAIGIVPVVVLEDDQRAVDTAQALIAGGIPVMEITFRTQAAAKAIQNVAENCPQMLVGAGTIITLDQCKQAVEAGAKFIVCPGYDEDVVRWCVERDVLVIPGCVTPTEITAALKNNLKVVKFFPANVLGGLKAMKELSGPFRNIKFMPTGGIGNQNIGELATAPFIHAVGGSWICSKKWIDSGDYEKITLECMEARKNLLGYRFTHMGLNAESAQQSQQLSQSLQQAFGFSIQSGDGSYFSGDEIEIMKRRGYGEYGHIAILTNCIDRAMEDLKNKGFEFEPGSEKYANGRLNVVYLKNTFGGFAIHLIQRPMAV